MRRIRNDKAFRQKVKEFNDNLFKARRSDFVKPAVKLAELRTGPGLRKRYKMPAKIIIAYVEKIEEDYDKIIAAEEKQMQDFIADFKVILAGQPISTEFYKAVAKALRYDALQEKEFPEFIRKTDLKTCSYCHSQSTIVFDKLADGSIKAMFQIDHKYPQSQYPFLATSFYNLYPICGNCNLAKTNNPSGFELYTQGKDLDLLHFGLDDKSIARYWNSNDSADLEITITPAKGQKKLVGPYLKMFMIKEVYNMQIDIAEELVYKQRVYNDDYKRTLVDSFKALFPDLSMLNRLLIGNYDKPEEMTKRPTAKFIQEIARDIGLIPK
ncbi:MAG: hypothetical protein JWQ66_373 [Mucilaginibacter sp.]|nr:hypothetical protein [Mucilaginibacter sp.]